MLIFLARASLAEGYTRSLLVQRIEEKRRVQSVFALNITKYVVVLLCLISLFNGVDFIAAVLYALYVNEANCARNWSSHWCLHRYTETHDLIVLLFVVTTDGCFGRSTPDNWC